MQTVHANQPLLFATEKLELTTNSLTGSLPEAFSQLASLGTSCGCHWFAYANACGLTHHFLTCLEITEALQLNENSLTGSIPDSIGSLSSLRELFIHPETLSA